MTSIKNKETSLSSQDKCNDVVEDYEWNESKRTETAWTWSMREKSKRGKRSYGRRSNIISTTKESIFAAKNEESRRRKRGLTEADQTGSDQQQDLYYPSREGFQFMDVWDSSAELSSDTENPSASIPRQIHKRAESVPSRTPMNERPRFESLPSRLIIEDNEHESDVGNENVDPNLKGRDKEVQSWSPKVKNWRSSSLHQSASYAAINKLAENEISTATTSSQHVDALNSGEKCQSPTFSAVSGSSFSSLSRGGNIAPTRVKQPLLDDEMRVHQKLKSTLDNACFSSIESRVISGSQQSVAIDLTEITSSNACITPARSTSSSRKRCVCHSPTIDGDEITSTDGISIGRLSTSSYGSRRARSRIFSPKKFVELESVPCCNPENQVNTLSDDGFCSPHRSDGSEIEGQSTCNQDSSHKSDEIDNGNNKRKEQGVSSDRTEDGLLKFPPSKPRRVSSIEGGSFADTVFAPVENIERKEEVEMFKNISSYQDLKFLVNELRRWSDGKRIVSFGMSNNCTIVPPNKWPSSRKAAFIKWATSYLGFCLRSGGGTVNYLQTKLSKAIAIHQDLENMLIEYKKNQIIFVAKNKIENPCKRNPTRALKNEEARAPLSSIRIMSNVTTTPLLHMSTSAARSGSRRLMSIERPIFSPLDCDVDENLVGKLNTLNLNMERSQFMRTSDKETSEKDIYDDEENAISITSLAVNTKGDSKVSKKPPRLSYETSVLDNRDFMSHLHAVSPNCTNNAQNIQPSALVIPRRKLNECTGGISPSIQSIAALSFDGVETPMPKMNCRVWGSQPVRGKDWGQSTRCTSVIISLYRAHLEEAVSLRHENRGINTVILDSDGLGFDFEADSDENQVKDIEETRGCIKESVESKSTLSKEESLGASGFAALNLNDELSLPEKVEKRRKTSFAKHQRMSICASAKWHPRLTFKPKPSNLLSCADGDVAPSRTQEEADNVIKVSMNDENILSNVFSYLKEHELLCSASPVCTKWADTATDAHACLMLLSVGCKTDVICCQSNDAYDVIDDDISLEDIIDDQALMKNSVARSMQRSWDYLTENFPWGNFLSEGAFKKVFKVWNTSIEAEEAVSVMNVDLISDKDIVGAELSVSVMLSSLVRRNVCPNFVLTRGVFTSQYEPPSSCWGNFRKKKPLGNAYKPSLKQKKPRKPNSKYEGNYQYIRMELCRHGDIEEYIKSQPSLVLHAEESRNLLFQMAFALHVAKDRFALKHYDVKLLNYFLQSADQTDTKQKTPPQFTIMRYGVGEDIFDLKMQTSRALIAKLADYGTANVQPESDGQPVLLSNFTTIENSPPEFMILGDGAQQGYGHDYFGLGLSMLHLFTGYAPYEEILEEVTCPKNLKKELQEIWESSDGYEVIRSVILGDVYEDENGNIEGKADDTLYHTFYRYMVLFGVPNERNELKGGIRVLNAIESCLGTQNGKTKLSKQNASKTKVALDAIQFENDCKKYSFMQGNNKHISRARRVLQEMEGGVDLLLNLVSFVPSERATSLDVIKSKFMASLQRKSPTSQTAQDEVVHSYMAYHSKE